MVGGYARRTGRAARGGLMGIRRIFRSGKVHDVGAGVGGGILASAAISRITPNPTANSVGGIIGGYAFGGLWGAVGYAALRIFTSGLQLGSYNLSLAGLRGQARAGLATGAGVQAI